MNGADNGVGLHAGYSGKSAASKLGLKDDQAVAFIGLPPELSKLTESAHFVHILHAEDCDGLVGGAFDYAHLFTRSESELRRAIPLLLTKIRPDGMIWVSWPKKSSGVPSEVDENLIRKLALEGDLVDVKVCAVNEIWSGLKLVIRKDRRMKYEQG